MGGQLQFFLQKINNFINQLEKLKGKYYIMAGQTMYCPFGEARTKRTHAHKHKNSGRNIRVSLETAIGLP